MTVPANLDELIALLRSLSKRPPIERARLVRSIPNAARAILGALAAERPPLRLALGPDAVEVIRGQHDALRADLDAWEEVARATGL